MKILVSLFFLGVSMICVIGFEVKSMEKELNPPTTPVPKSPLSIKGDSTTGLISNKLSNTQNNLKPQINSKLPETNTINRVEMPSTIVNSLSTEIFLSKHRCSAEIKEIALFTISNGIFSTITRRISLDGSADSISGFKLASADVMLREARIIKNCYHDKAILDHPYVCIIAVFDEENLVGKSKLVEIEYTYNAENLMKTKKKPFSNDNQKEDNVLIWIYDNYQSITPINKVKLKVNFDEKFNTKDIMTYPEKFFKKNKEDMTNIVEWEKEEIPPNSYQNFSIHVPKFKEGCRSLNEIHFDFSYYSVLQIFMCFLIMLIFICVVVFIYLNEKEKSESLKLNEEIDNFKRLSNFNTDTTNQSRNSKHNQN